MKKVMLLVLALLIQLCPCSAGQYTIIPTFRSLSSRLYNKQLSYQFRESIEFVEEMTKTKMPVDQVDAIREHIERHGIAHIPSNQNRIVRKAFGVQRSKLIDQWEYNNHLKWPRENKNIDAHHLVFVSYGGVNEWWNLWPMDRQIHMNEIHGVDSPIELFYQCMIGFDKWRQATQG